jgi:hypothetical protein
MIYEHISNNRNTAEILHASALAVCVFALDELLLPDLLTVSYCL